MTTLHAQLTDNIDAVAQWNTAADGSGSPVAFAAITAADTLEANGKTVTINASVTASALTTASGGGFTISDGDWDNVDSSFLTGSPNTYATASDNSISTSDAFSPVPSAGDWVRITGFANWQNNGFKKVATATSSKITFTSDGIAMVDEASGETIIGYVGGIVITADITAGTSNCLSSTVGSGDAVLVVGDARGGTSTAARGIYSYAALLYFIGNVSAHTGNNSNGMYLVGGETHICGSVTGGTGSSAAGIDLGGSPDLYLHGDIINEDGKVEAVRWSTSSQDVLWQPALPTNYIQFPNGSGGTIKAYAETYLAEAADVRDGTVNGPVTGTLEIGSVPDAPTLTVTDNADGSVTAAVTGSGTITLYYRLFGATSWTTGTTRTGDGDITQTGLTQGQWYEFYATANDGLESGPSALVRVLMDDGDNSIEATLYAILSGDLTVASLVSDRIYPQIVPQDTDMPCVRYSLISSVPNHHFGGMSTMVPARFQLSIYTETFSGLRSISTAIRAALDSKQQTTGGIEIASSFMNDENDSTYESPGNDRLRRYVRDMDFTITYQI